ncbi:hypothetical protein F511_24247 [Dorcoceras hygrometricum]|uniref:Uncharacterized protein n=1 Tax=Dorcoceras hygrometricum TaxID=472368 RepID=A0A2Z7A9B8_9LAMI|nr:hypothetical protein F511_24247 [Dorcoceras hygrometricum]
MANQIKRRNVSSLTHESFPRGHPSQYCSHPCTLNSTQRMRHENPRTIRLSLPAQQNPRRSRRRSRPPEISAPLHRLSPSINTASIRGASPDILPAPSDECFVVADIQAYSPVPDARRARGPRRGVGSRLNYLATSNMILNAENGSRITSNH